MNIYGHLLEFLGETNKRNAQKDSLLIASEDIFIHTPPPPTHHSHFTASLSWI